MTVDPRVVRQKYDRELSRLVQQRSTLEDRGIFVLVSSVFPHIDLFFAPRHPLRAAFPPSGDQVAQVPQGAFIVAEVPSLSARGFKARFDLTDYDLRAPSLDFFDAWSGEPLQFLLMFRALEFEEQRKAHVVLLGDHPQTHRPFLCLRGIREYHEHPQHSGDDWLLYRPTMNLFSIVMSVWRVSIDLVRAHLLPAPGGIQVQWTADEKL